MNRSNCKKTCCYTFAQLQLINTFRKFWEQHIMWTRAFIISTVTDSNDLPFVTDRLMENPSDFSMVWKNYYCIHIVNEFKWLMEQHLQIGGKLITAVKNGFDSEVESLRTAWYANGEELARFLSQVNSWQGEKQWKTMLFNHLDATERQVKERLAGNYANDIEIYGEIETMALQMADYMSWGLINQMCLK